MNTKDFYFDLPEELIAQIPLEDRSASRMLFLNKKTGEVQHKKFTDFIEFLNENDCIVLNDSRVLPARIFGKKDTGSVVEFLLLKRIDKNRWETLVKPGKKAKVGNEFSFGNGELRGIITGMSDDGARIIEFIYDGIFEEILDKLGTMPLPPYIKEKLEDKERYQTVYSKVNGSAAAPTAGLHFTKDVLEKIEKKGVKICYVTLHVGLGTFRPVKVENIMDHSMHSEYYSIDENTAKTINDVKKSGGRIISVGTTSTRTLESASGSDGNILCGNGWTDIFIYPGYKFKVIDGLLTNFHLPESTLIMLVSAIAGRENVLNAYGEAVREKYRFFSFGDSMLIL